MKTWLNRYGLAFAALVVVLATFIASFFVPSRYERQAAEFDACKQRCLPREGVMQGKKVLPNAPITDRRNYETFATCVCK